MEAAGVLNICSHPGKKKTLNVRYIKYQEDGDSKEFDAKVYGNNINADNLKCIVHFQKGIGACLRALQNDWRKKNSPMRNAYSSCIQLTDAEMDKL